MICISGSGDTDAGDVEVGTSLLTRSSDRRRSPGACLQRLLPTYRFTGRQPLPGLEQRIPTRIRANPWHSPNATQPPAIETDGNGGFYLIANEIDNRPARVPFYEVAPVILQRINGLARAKNASYRPVSLSGRYQEGDSRHQVVLVDTAECREQAMPIIPLINGAPVSSPPPPGPCYAALASVDADVAEVLEIMGRPEAPNWGDLYKVYEIIEYTGRLKVAMAGAGISPNRASLFVRTACHPDASGPEARHGRSKQDPPKNPMPVSQARAMIGELVVAWMDLLAQSGRGQMAEVGAVRRSCLVQGGPGTSRVQAAPPDTTQHRPISPNVPAGH
jgi:hypothetical protein